MISKTAPVFWDDLRQLPPPIQKLARQTFREFLRDPYQSSLHFKKMPPFKDIWSVRVNFQYRALGKRKGDTLLWFFIGSHAQYYKLLSRL